MRRPLHTTVAVAAVAVLALAACGDDDGAAGPDTTDAPDQATTTAAPPEPLRILLSNDDGIVHPAVDVFHAVLSAEPEMEITVVAPTEDRSGTSDFLTEGGADYEPATSPGGIEGYAVDGFPADTVVVGLDELGLEPHLVVSGVNPGQNFGPFSALSGTVGVGRTAIRRDVPALAVSAAIEMDDEQFEFAAGLAVDWIREHRDDLVAGTHQTDTVTSINVPACPVDDMGELLEVGLAPVVPEGNVFESTCDQADPDPADDIAAVVAGYPAITQVPADPEFPDF